MLNRLSRFASNLMICLLATVMLLGIGCLAGLTQEVNAATKVVRVDRKTEMDGKEFKNWVESSNRVHEGIHNVELINNWDVSSQQDDGMMVFASMNFYFNDYYIKGNNDDTLFWISDNVEINMYGNGPDSKIFNCGDYYEDGGVFNLDGSNIKLKLENVSIEENRADRGAAMYIGGYDNQVLLRDSYLNSNSVDAWHNRGYIQLFVYGDYPLAIEYFTQALMIDPNSLESLTNRGCAYEMNGNAEAAADDFRAALQIQQGYAPAVEGLKRLGK